MSARPLEKPEKFHLSFTARDLLVGSLLSRVTDRSAPSKHVSLLREKRLMSGRFPTDNPHY